MFKNRAQWDVASARLQERNPHTLIPFAHGRYSLYINSMSHIETLHKHCNPLFHF